MKTRSYYEIREFVGSSFSRRLGAKLRTFPEARRIIKRLRRAGRDVYAAQMRVYG